MPKAQAVVDRLSSRIVPIRGRRVMIDADLAALYGVTTKAFNQAVKRNLARFPADFVFQVTASEKEQVVTICDHLANLRYSASLPYAFTEHGAIMAATVLRSPAAVEMSVYVVRAFVQMRSLANAHRELAAKIAAIDKKVGDHDAALRDLIQIVRSLTAPPAKKRRPIGFVIDPMTAGD